MLTLGSMTRLGATLVAVIAHPAHSLECVEDYDPTIAYFSEDMRASVSPKGDTTPQLEEEIVFADDFSITYYKAYKVVKNYKSDETFVLYLCGTPVPGVADIPDDAVTSTAKFFQIPVAAIATQETVTLNFMEHLDLQEKMVYGPLSFTSSPCLQKLGEEGEITQIASSFSAEEEYLQQVSSVDLVFISNFAHSSGGDLPNSVTFDTSTDPGSLNRLEWIKFMATFTNDEAKANTYMKQIVERYTCTQQVASELAGNKTVAFISISSFFGNVISLADYKLEFINHAGGINPFSMDAVTSFSDIAELAAAIADVDVLIDETYAPDPTAYTIDTFKAHFAGVDIPIKAIENGQVWREDRLINPNGALEWFESPFPQPDALLQEMVQVVNWESASQSGYFPRVWLRHLSLGEQPIVKTAADCDENNTPEIYGEDCSAMFIAQGYLSALAEFQALPDVNGDKAVNVLDVVFLVGDRGDVCWLHEVMHKARARLSQSFLPCN